ncbi:MAG: hypothetical protein HWD61_05380 [Parachlamydiaceae bacterium]|nr:MAG: hypothetical protein HWD61_05380 [Parachlamydiaceae bacterium]
MASPIPLERSSLHLSTPLQIPLLHVGQGKKMELIELSSAQSQHFTCLASSSPVVYLREIEPEIFHALLQSLPDFETLTFNVENVNQFQFVAQKLGSEKLAQKCHAFLNRPRAIFDANNANHSKEHDISPKLVALSAVLSQTEYPFRFQTLTLKDLNLLNQFAEGNYTELNNLISNISDLESLLKGAYELQIYDLLEKCKIYLLGVLGRISGYKNEYFENNIKWLEQFLKFMKVCHAHKLSDLSNKFTHELRAF